MCFPDDLAGEAYLHKYLNENYIRARPRRNPAEVVNVSLSMSLNTIIGLVSKYTEQIIVVIPLKSFTDKGNTRISKNEINMCT